ncbi:hypothetical protein CN189_12205, partial [Sinorhizobium meliloti]
WGRHHLGIRGRLFLGIGGRDHFGIRGRIASEFAPQLQFAEWTRLATVQSVMWNDHPPETLDLSPT